MPRTARASVAGYWYHVLNRGNARSEVFHKPEDFTSFLEIIAEVSLRLSMGLLAYCLMPNHFHLVLRPLGDGDLSRRMQWLLTTHVPRYLKHYGHSGHVWQGRFKAFPIQEDEHLVTVVRYVERNPLRASLAVRAKEWPWSSLAGSIGNAAGPRLASEDLPRRGDWCEFVNAPMTQSEADAIALSIRRDRPFGSENWTHCTAERLGPQSSPQPRGGRKHSKKTTHVA